MATVATVPDGGSSQSRRRRMDSDLRDRGRQEVTAPRVIRADGVRSCRFHGRSANSQNPHQGSVAAQGQKVWTHEQVQVCFKDTIIRTRGEDEDDAAAKTNFLLAERRRPRYSPEPRGSEAPLWS